MLNDLKSLDTTSESKPTKNINILGWYGKNNAGDESFRFAFENIFQNQNLNFYTPPKPCPSADLVVLGGGAVISPYYLDALPDGLKIAMGVDVAYESEIDLIAKYDFKEVYIRHTQDLAAMQKKLPCPVKHIPDLAYMHQLTKSNILQKYKKDKKRKTLGVMLTDYVNPAIDRSFANFGLRANNFIVNISQTLDKFYREENYEIILIPLSTGGYGDDRRLNFDLMAYMKNPAINILDTLSVDDLISLISDLDLSLCMKFHAHIFSLIANTPLISIPFTRKVRLFLEENKLNHLICANFNGDEFDVSQMIETANIATENYNQEFADIAKKNYLDLQKVKKVVLENWIRS